MSKNERFRNSFSSETFSFAVPTTEYKFEFATSNLQGAGTDANVFVILYGEKGVTEKFPIASNGNFAAGKIFQISFKAKDVGFIKSIRVGHDNSGNSPGISSCN
jgi:hypothetical protein